MNQSAITMSEAKPELTRLRAAAARKGDRAPAEFIPLLRAAWTIHALNRPAYEAMCSAHNEALYQSLKANPVRNFDQAMARDTELRQTTPNESEALDEASFDVVYKLTGRISRSQPKDMRDLAALANACAIVNDHLWREENDRLDWEEQHVRNLVEAVVKLAGEQLVLEGLPIPQCVSQNAFERIREENENRSA